MSHDDCKSILLNILNNIKEIYVKKIENIETRLDDEILFDIDTFIELVTLHKYKFDLIKMYIRNELCYFSKTGECLFDKYDIFIMNQLISGIDLGKIIGINNLYNDHKLSNYDHDKFITEITLDDFEDNIIESVSEWSTSFGNLFREYIIPTIKNEQYYTVKYIKSKSVFD